MWSNAVNLTSVAFLSISLAPAASRHVSLICYNPHSLKALKQYGVVKPSCYSKLLKMILNHQLRQVPPAVNRGYGEGC